MALNLGSWQITEGIREASERLTGNWYGKKHLLAVRGVRNSATPVSCDWLHSEIALFYQPRSQIGKSYPNLLRVLIPALALARYLVFLPTIMCDAGYEIHSRLVVSKIYKCQEQV